MAEEVTDSPIPWVADHIRRFVESGGQPRPGIDDLLLTTRGRRSGALRRTVLVYVRQNAGYVVVASNAGAEQHPAWYLNLVADPHVTVQVGVDVFAAHARIATDREAPGLWQLMIDAMPSYQRYRQATTRRIPLVILQPT
jgi:deazaflavin-dependent oxidoreductase (nitroreductase family)